MIGRASAYGDASEATVIAKERYHHKDLRNALLSEAISVLEETGTSKLSLRELARRLGVTHTAAYAHFPDKTALLREVAELGFARLTEALSAGKASNADAASAFLAMGKAYVRFAREQPSLYRLMFVDESLSEGPASEMSPEGQCAFDVLAGTIVDLGVPGDAVLETSITAWGFVHGIAMLDIDCRIGVTKESGEAIAALGCEIFLRGLPGVAR